VETGEQLHNLEPHCRTLLASARARVLNVDEQPIPRLSEADDLGCASTFCAGDGSRITDCIVLGRIAAQNAAAEEPWE